MAPLESKSTNAMPPTESKSSKKKKAKAEVAEGQPPPASTEGEVGARRDSADVALNGAEGTHESPYIKELQKYAWVSCPCIPQCVTNLTSSAEISAISRRSSYVFTSIDTIFVANPVP